MTNHVARASLVIALVGLGAVAACSDTSSDPTPSDAASDGGAASGCVDFVVADGDTSCTSSADCTFVDSLRVCPGDTACGGQIPTNRAASARFQKETSGVTRGTGQCGAAAPEACVAGRCVVCSGSGTCPDGG